MPFCPPQMRRVGAVHALFAIAGPISSLATKAWGIYDLNMRFFVLCPLLSPLSLG